MPTPKKLVARQNMVDNARSVAEELLQSLIINKIVPKNFSGLLTPRFGSHIMVWQFDHNKLVGAAAIHVNNIPQITKKLIAAPNSVDWANLPQQPAKEMEDIAGHDLHGESSSV